MPETAALLLPPSATEFHPPQAQSRLGGATSSAFTTMDASIMKLLEEDDYDETLHSGADLEALQAALNRDIAGGDSTSLLPPLPHSDRGSEFSKHDIYTTSKDKNLQPQKQILPKMELKQNGAVLEHGRISKEANQRKEGERNVPHANNGQHTMQATGSGNDTQYLNLQKMSNQHQNLPGKLTNQNPKQVAFGSLLPIIVPQLDKDKGMQLTTLYEKLKKNDVSKEQFRKIMRSIVGDQMLRLAVERVGEQSSVQQKQIVVQTSAPQDHLPKQPANGTTATSKLLPQKRNIAETHSGPAFFQQLHSRTTPSSAGADSTKPYKPYDGFKKPVDTHDSSQPSLSKKPKVSGAFEDQSIEKLIDVTAISGVNLMEEEQRLFSGLKEDRQVSGALRKAVKEEEGKLFLQRLPLQKRVARIMAKCGMKKMSKDVERCLSLSVEERIRGLLLNLIRSSKQRVDTEKQKHQTVITSDIHQHLMILNRKANEIWMKKQTDEEKSKKLSEPECTNGVDVEEKESNEVRGKPLKASNKEDDKMRTTAANVAARAAVGGDDVLSKWQLMAEEAARRKREGAATIHNPGRVNKDASGSVRKQQGKKQQVSAASPQHGGADRTVSVKDVIGVLEREPQMSKSVLLYHLYHRT